MMVDQLDINGVVRLEPKDEAPVGTDLDRPEAIEITFEGMKPPTREIHVARLLCEVEGMELSSELVGPLRWYPTPIPPIALDERLEASMPKPQNRHDTQEVTV